MDKMIIDNIEYRITGSETILDSAKVLDIEIPTLCHNEHIKPYGACRLCLVEVALKSNPEAAKLMPACTTLADPNYIIKTKSERIQKARHFIMEMLLSRCPESNEIKALAEKIGVYSSENNRTKDYLLNRAASYTDTKCILCGLCVRVCDEITERYALGFSGRGMKRRVNTPFDKISDSCIGCGSCAYVCPTKTITLEEA
ncbi:MAG: 4Fe-4S binding protein [Spirochaetales bacterium]|nr:4Fe-4S binding protein [Spirochaetales bacterium]